MLHKLLWLLLIPLSLHASFYEQDRATLAPSRNMLKNGGFESLKASWTASAGTFATTTSSPLFGSTHATFDAANSGEYVYQQVTSTAGYFGRQGVAMCVFKTASGTSAYDLEVYDATNSVPLSDYDIPSSTTPARVHSNFIFPETAANIQIRIMASTNEPSIAFDECYLGLAENIIVAKPQDVFSAKINSSDTVSEENVDWINGDCTAGTTGEGLCLFNPGIFTVTPNCQCTPSANTQSGQCYIDVTQFDATQLRYHTNDNNGAGANKGINLLCQKAGADAFIPAIKPGAAAQSWSGYHDNTCSWARTNTAYGDPATDASCALTQRTNQNFGTVTTAAGTLPGVIFNPRDNAKYKVCARVSVLGATSGADAAMKLWDGTTTIAEADWDVPGTSLQSSITICGQYQASATSATLTIQIKSSTGALTIQALTGASAIEWEISKVSENMNTPVYLNTVQSNYSSILKVITAKLVCSGSASISSQTGSVSDGVASIGNVSGGACSITLANGTFSSTPFCTVSSATSGGFSTGLILNVDVTSSTGVSVDCEDDASGACTSYTVQMQCVGAR